MSEAVVEFDIETWPVHIEWGITAEEALCNAEAFMKTNFTKTAGTPIPEGHGKWAYIAGPMRGIPEFNFPAFDAVTKKYREKGYVVFSPAEHDRINGFNPIGMTGNEDLDKMGFDLTDAIMWDLNAVADVDTIVMLPGWLKSSGASLEYKLATFLGKTVLFE